MKPKTLVKDTADSSQRRVEKKDFSVEIGKHLRKIRESTGISQEQLSIKAGYYHTYVNKIEQGKYSPSLHTIWRLSYALGMTLESFFKGF
jgi:transcriptional regulator with XRE-family HTH domain